MDIVHPRIEEYLLGLAANRDDEVLREMEAYASEHGFPIVGRLCGMFLETMARAVRAARVFEMGSGYGYSAYWFARATGSDGEIHLTDTDADNEKRALAYLSRAGLDGPIEYHVSDAFEAFDSVDGDFDVIYCDINKGDYPEAWRRARDRVRVGGLYMCDNMLWSGRVTGDLSGRDEPAPGWTEAIVETNAAIFSDDDFASFVNPTRDGVIAALRIRRTGPA